MLQRLSASLVKYNLAMTGAISRILRDKLADVINPKDFGAKGDGITDDTDAFTAAISALPEGGTLDLGGKTYLAQANLTKRMTIRNGNIKAAKDAWACVLVSADGCIVEDLYVVVDNNNRDWYTQLNVSGILANDVDCVYVRNCTSIGSKCERYDASTSWGVAIGAFNSREIIIENCVTRDAHKEGIMTRKCDRVFISNCQGSGAGYSNIGTSWGNVAFITECYSTDCNATGITMNNNTSIVANCIVEGTRQYQGILIGHSHEELQKAGMCMVTGCIVKDVVGSGITIDSPTRASITDNVIENAGISGSTGNGITVNNPQGANCQVIIDGNNIHSVTGNGVYAAQSTGEGYELQISNNAIRQTTLFGIRVENDKYTKISNNRLRSIGSNAIRLWSTQPEGLFKTAIHAMLNGNTVEYSTLAAVDILGYDKVTCKGNSYLGYNQQNNQYSTAMIIRGNVSGVAAPLPTELHIQGESFLQGNVGSSMTTITLEGNSGTTSGHRVTVQGCHFYDDTRDPINNNSKYNIFYGNNRRGSDANFKEVVVPPNESLVVSNSNATTLALPSIVGKDSGSTNCVIQARSLGSLTLRNYNTTTSATMQLTW